MQNEGILKYVKQYKNSFAWRL